MNTPLIKKCLFFNYLNKFLEKIIIIIKMIYLFQVILNDHNNSMNNNND